MPTSPLPPDVTSGDADGLAGGLSHTERVLYGRAGALKQWSEIPLAARPAKTEAALEARLLKLEREIDPEGKLDPGERRQLALQARRAHMQKIAAKSAQARRMRGAGLAPAKPIRETAPRPEKAEAEIEAAWVAPSPRPPVERLKLRSGAEGVIGRP